jgi:uncharacterized membrane protein YhaH (DUF805 family)
MDLKTRFLTAEGRLGRKDFWTGVLMIVGVQVLFGWIPLLGLLLELALIYPWVCLVAKRLHDFGRSGWLAAFPHVSFLVMAVIVGGLDAAGVIAIESQSASMGQVLIEGVIGLAYLTAAFGFLFWVGLSKSDPQANAYGPTPGLAPERPPALADAGPSTSA